MRKINEKVVLAIAESLIHGSAGSLELKRLVDKRLDRDLPHDTYYRYLKISNGLGIINSTARARKVRGGYQTVHFLTERARKHMALGFSLLDMTKYHYHKNYKIVSVGDLTEDEEIYRLFVILASFDTIETDVMAEIYATDENELVEKIQGIVPTLSRKDLVAEGTEELIDGRIITSYKPLACFQIWREEFPPNNTDNKQTENKNIITNSKSIQDQEQETTITAEFSLTKRRITFFHIRALGVSASDIIRYSLRNKKFIGTITRPLSLTRVKRALSLLRREQVISPIGKLKGETRYTITDERVRSFIGNCLVIQDQIIELMNKLWQYRIRKVDHNGRRLLQMIYGHRRADQIISDNFAFLDDELPGFIEKELSWRQELLSSSSDQNLTNSSSTGSSYNDNQKAAIRAEIEKLQKEIEEKARGTEKYIRKQIQEMRSRYANTFKEYRFPLERIMQLVALPYVDSDKKKHRA